MLDEVIYVTDSTGYGGAEKYLLELVARAKNVAQDVSVAMPFREGNEEVRKRLSDLGIKLYDLPQYRANYLLNLALAFRFFLGHKQSTFHFSLCYPDACRWLLLAASLLGCKFVITEHLVPEDPFKAGFYFMWSFLLFNGLKKYSYQKAIAVATVSEAIKRTLITHYRMPAEKIHVVYNGVTIAQQRCSGTVLSQFDVAPGSVILTNIGRLTEQKGQLLLVEAVARLKKYDFVLFIVGDGPLFCELEATIEKLQLQDNVKLLGYRTDIGEILAATDIFVLPSLNEGFPFTILEAMAAARPVLASDVGGNREAVVNDVTGILVSPGEEDALVQGLARLLEDADLREQMGQMGYKRVKDMFSVESMVENTFSLYYPESAAQGL